MAHFLTSHLSSIYFLDLCASLSFEISPPGRQIRQFITVRHLSPVSSNPGPFCVHFFAPTLDQFAPYIFNGQYSVFNMAHTFSSSVSFCSPGCFPLCLLGGCFHGHT
ncbi:MAG: hypothetical protein BYD32DRAFT_430743 [Podila humilis]|nr:MAG: hypothetical protein BYD32DRAFT_430743 [Podila humilis]